MYGQYSNSVIPKAFGSNTLEGNWYEDRCKSTYDNDKKKNYSLSNPSSWMYETTTSKIGKYQANYPTLKQKFSQSNDNYINFQDKKNGMYVTINKQAWGLGIGDWAQSPIPNPQSPIPNN